jgi:hypothetical protein
MSMESDLFDPNWKHILVRAWSSKLLMLAGAMTAVEVSAPLLWDHGLLDLPPYVYPLGMGIVVSTALVARLMVQEGF